MKKTQNVHFYDKENAENQNAKTNPSCSNLLRPPAKPSSRNSKNPRNTLNTERSPTFNQTGAFFRSNFQAFRIETQESRFQNFQNLRKKTQISTPKENSLKMRTPLNARGSAHKDLMDIYLKPRSNTNERNAKLSEAEKEIARKDMEIVCEESTVCFDQKSSEFLYASKKIEEKETERNILNNRSKTLNDFDQKGAKNQKSKSPNFQNFANNNSSKTKSYNNLEKTNSRITANFSPQKSIENQSINDTPSFPTKKGDLENQATNGYSEFLDHAFAKLKLIFGEKKVSLNRQQLTFFLHRLEIVGDLQENWTCKRSEDEKLSKTLFSALLGSDESEIRYEQLRLFLITTFALQKNKISLIIPNAAEKAAKNESASQNRSRVSSISNKRSSSQNTERLLSSQNPEEPLSHSKNALKQNFSASKFTPKVKNLEIPKSKAPALTQASYFDETDIQFSFRKLTNSSNISAELRCGSLNFVESENNDASTLDQNNTESQAKIEKNDKIQKMEQFHKFIQQEHHSSYLLKKKDYVNETFQTVSVDESETLKREIGTAAIQESAVVTNWIIDSNYFQSSTENIDDSAEKKEVNQSLFFTLGEKAPHVSLKKEKRGSFLFCAEVNFNNEKKKITVYENDDVNETASKFAVENQLNEKMSSKLLQILKNKREIVLADNNFH